MAFDKFKDECGVFGIYGHPEAANLTYLGLYALQHRGQESCGIVASDGARMRAHRGMGLVADVFKHALLARLLVALRRKDKPFLYLDTHAGAGLYDLEHPWAKKNAEYRAGIGRIFGSEDVPPLAAPYLEAVRAENPDGRLRRYPGSPLIARGLLRAGDRAILSELNKKDCAQLEALFARDRRVVVRLMDGYQSLKAHLPPKERRGLVLIDSSFDRKHEFDDRRHPPCPQS